VFGRIAAGHSNIFWPADPRELRRQARREAKRKPSAAERADMRRSEDLAGVCQPLWELRSGLRREPPIWFCNVPAETLKSPLVERILGRLDEFAARWQALQAGAVSPWRGHWTGATYGVEKAAVALTAVTAAGRRQERRNRKLSRVT
jgi:hypothetical protein